MSYTSRNSSLPRSPVETLPRSPIDTNGSSGFKMSRSMSASSLQQGSTVRTMKIKENNEKLRGLVAETRKLRTTADAIDSSSTVERTERILEIREASEAEIADYRAKYELILSQLNKAQIDISNLEQDMNKIRFSIKEKLDILKDRDIALAASNEDTEKLLTNLNLLQSDKEKLRNDVDYLTKDKDKLKKEYNAVRKALDKEKMRRGELQNKLATSKEAANFKILMLEEEIVKERNKRKIDTSVYESELRDKYNRRLNDEYELWTREARARSLREMNSYCDKIMEMRAQLQSQLKENGVNGAGLEISIRRLEEYKRRLMELERETAELEKQTAAASQETMREEQYRLNKLNEHIGNMISELSDRIQLDYAIEFYTIIINRELQRFPEEKRGQMAAFAQDMIDGYTTAKRQSDSGYISAKRHNDSVAVQKVTRTVKRSVVEKRRVS